jgi:hypothetical protein
MEVCILEVIESLAASERIHSEALAVKAGYSCSGTFKALLSRLVRDGKIRGSRDGYSRVDGSRLDVAVE